MPWWREARLRCLIYIVPPPLSVEEEEATLLPAELLHRSAAASACVLLNPSATDARLHEQTPLTPLSPVLLFWAATHQLLAESTVATARRPAAAADDAPLEDVGTVMSILDSENDQAAGSDLARVLDDQSTVAGSVMEPASPSLQRPAQGGGGLSRMGPPPSDGRVLRRKGSGVSDRL